MRALVLFSVFTLSTFAVARDVTIEEFISTAKDDKSIAVQDEKNIFLKKAFPGVPFIDEIELRAQEKAFDVNNIEYSVRIQPRGIGETFASHKYRKAHLKKSEHKRLLVQEEAAKNRYLLIIDMLEQKAMHTLYEQLMDVYGDKIKVMEKMSTVDPEFEIVDLIKVENDNIKAQATDMEFLKMMELLKITGRDYLKDTSFTGFDTTGLISIDTLVSIIEGNLASGAFKFDTNNAYIKDLRLELDIEEEQYKLERAESRKYVSYLGFGYDNGERLDQLEKKREDKDYNFNESFTLEVGIKLPFLTTSPDDIVKRKSDYLKAKDQYESAKKELSYYMNEDLNDLKYYIIQYRYLKAREQEVDAEASLKKYMEFKGVDPLVLLTIKENILKNQINRTSVVYGLFRNYIQVIDVTGDLTRWPQKNFLLQQ